MIAFLMREPNRQAALSAAASGAVTRPASTAASSAARVRVVRSPSTAWPCWSWSSWTVHSTSDRPPGPSFRCSARSVPRGIRSASIRALIRRISRTAGSPSPPGGYLNRSASAMNSAPSSGLPTANSARSRAWNSHGAARRS